MQSEVPAELESLVAEINRDLNQKVQLRPPSPGDSSVLPPPLRELYTLCDGGNIVFGELYPRAQAMAFKEAPPFSPAWVPFGGDGTGVFWLCACEPENSNWFTSWDHDADVEIDGPVFSTLGAFLNDSYRRRLSARSGDGNLLVLSAVPKSALARTTVEVKNILGCGMADALLLLKTLPARIPIASAIEAKQTMERLREVGVECHMQLEFF